MNRELLIYVATDLYSAGYGKPDSDAARITACFDTAELILAEGKKRIEADMRGARASVEAASPLVRACADSGCTSCKVALASGEYREG